MLIRYSNKNSIYNDNFTVPFEQGGLLGHVDLPRLKAGKVGGSFWSAFVLCPSNGSDFSNDNYAEAVRQTFSQVDLLTRLAAKYPAVFSAATPNSSVAAAAFDEQHLLISPFAIEGLHQIGNSLATLRLLHSLNVKYATLTHNCHNVYADAALVENASGKTIAAPPLWGGVSKRGEVLVKEMNRLGMLVDLSHVSKNTMLDVLGGRPEKWNGSLAPIMFSHSSAYSLCPHPRNVQDDVLELVKVGFLKLVAGFPISVQHLPKHNGADSMILTEDNFSCNGEFLTRLHILRSIKFLNRVTGLLSAQLDPASGRKAHHVYRREDRL